jgi:penicillin-binding protein 1B
MGEDSQSLLDRLFHPQPVPNSGNPANPNNHANPNTPANPNNPQDDGAKHRNFFQKMFGIGKDKQQQQQQQQPEQTPPQN